MKEKEFPVLEITDIDWDKDHSELEKLPKNFQLKWDKKDWTFDDVSKWVSKKFDWIFDSININQVGVWEDSGCSCCAGGCSCC